jgi:hypothetical protein
MAFKCSTGLKTFLADLDAGDDDDEARTDAQHQLHTARFTGTTADNDDGFTGTVQWLHGKLLAHYSNALRSQHHVYMKTEAWAQDAAANHGLGGGLPSSVGEHGAGAGAGATAARPIAYRGGASHEENDRAAICAIIRDSSEHLTKTQIANKAGTKANDYHFSKLLNKYTTEDGGWRCTAATVAKRRKQYELV